MVWKYAESGPDGLVELFGVKIFDYAWKRCGEVAEVLDRRTGDTKYLPVYEVTIDGQPRRFAAGEMFMGIWAFYVES